MEGALDRAVMLMQENEEAADRSLHYPRADDPALSSELPAEVDRVSVYLGFDANSEPIPLAAPTGTSLTTPFSEDLLDDADAPTARATLVAQEDVITARGEVVRGDASGDAEALAKGARGSIFITDANDSLWLAVGAIGEYLRSDGTDPSWEPPDYKQNALINGKFDVWQRGTSFDSTTTPANSDDTYLMDRWLLLSDGNDRVDVTREATVVPTGCLYSVKLDVETVTAAPNSEKFGICQIIEQKNCAHLIGGTASLSFQARTTSGAVENIRAAVLSWDSTADTIAQYPVSAWNAEDAEPTWDTNWTREGSEPANLALTNAFQTFKIENISIDTASTTNIAVVWVDDTDLVATDVLYIADVQLVAGASVGNPLHRTFNEELSLCQRYFCKTFPYDTAPAQIGGATGALSLRATYDNVDSHLFIYWSFPVEMRGSPTLVTYNPSAANANFRNFTLGTDEFPTLQGLGSTGVGLLSTGAVDVAWVDNTCGIHASADAEL
jgi:hypothetical protein